VYKSLLKNKITIKKLMTNNFLILNCIGKDNKIGLKVDNNFFIHDFDQKINNYDQLVASILNFIKKYKVNFDTSFSILVNNGPGSFSSLRVSLAVAKGIRISSKINLFGFKNTDLGQFSLANIELLIKKGLIQKNLIKPIYIS
jgi:tRNA A37 threonylcarbamoyladenosine modification protein TsaB